MAQGKTERQHSCRRGWSISNSSLALFWEFSFAGVKSMLRFHVLFTAQRNIFQMLSFLHIEVGAKTRRSSAPSSCTLTTYSRQPCIYTAVGTAPQLLWKTCPSVVLTSVHFSLSSGSFKRMLVFQ